jgi:hypothetical protein
VTPLRVEADALHRALFRRPTPERLLTSYEDMAFAYGLSEAGDPLLARAIAQGTDLEALELALRRRDPRNFVTIRMCAVAYLAECDGEHYRDFVNDRPARIRGFATLAAALWRTVRLRARGRRLLRRIDG